MYDLIFITSVISTGLFAGLMMTLVFILQRQWMRQDKKDYAHYFKEFLLVAKGHPLITILSFVSFIAPIYLAIQSRDDAAQVALYAAASAVFFIGCFVVTVFLNLPIYRRVIAWRNDLDYDNWKEVRTKFFMLNITRFSSAFASLLLLLIAYIR